MGEIHAHRGILLSVNEQCSDWRNEMARPKEGSMFDDHLEDVIEGVKNGYSAKAMFDKYYGEENGYNYNTFRIWAWNKGIRYYARRSPKCVRCKNCGLLKHNMENIYYCRLSDKEIPKHYNPNWCPLENNE